MPASIPIGFDNFRRIREDRLEYIDKTRFIRQIIDDAGTQVLLLPRPRRFGKTVNMTMLEAFFAKSPEDLSHLFEGLEIWSAGDVYREHFQRYPTIFLSFKNVKPESETAWQQALRLKISEIFRIHRVLLDGSLLSSIEREEFEQCVQQTASDALLAQSLERLCDWLHRACGERVLILIDEYDTPIHAAWRSGCYKPVVNFFRAFFGSALKGNPHLHKGVLTGILRISKESIFSDLNNIKVKTLLDLDFSDAFGFTEAEVRTLCERQGQTAYLGDIQAWYNGYLFGGRTMYNPWSVLNFLDNPDKSPQPYWLGSSSNDLIKEVLTRHAVHVHDEFQTLLEGGSIQRLIEPNLVFPDIERSINAVFTLLLFSGYLKAERLPGDGQTLADCVLSIPNLEVRTVYRSTFQGWLEDALGGFGEQTRLLVNAILTGDEERLEGILGRLALRMLSFHDGSYQDPEALYHGLMLGLCATLEPQYQVRSNRESGSERPDLLILPTRPGQSGAVLELKVTRRGQTLKQVLAQGVKQLKNHKYAAELEVSPAGRIHKWAVAFNGKSVKVKWVG